MENTSINNYNSILEQREKENMVISMDRSNLGIGAMQTSYLDYKPAKAHKKIKTKDFKEGHRFYDI